MPSLEQQYNELLPRLDRLGLNMQAALEQFLSDADIDVLTVTHRTKSFQAFQEKLQRKQYSEPFSQTTDLCGVRVIACFPRDLSRIAKIIREEFVVAEVVTQTTKLHEDQFGYRSDHYVVTLRDGWLGAPNFRGLAGLHAEIQVRTILMHAWGNLSHRLFYKSAEQSPPEFRRRIFQLSALFELADEEFDRLQSQKQELQQALIRQAKDNPAGFDLAQPLNLDSLQAYLDFRFGDRFRLPDLTPGLLSELLDHKISFQELEDGYQSIKESLFQQEAEHFLAAGKLSKSRFPAHGEAGQWNQLGVVRQILDVTVDRYWQSRRKNVPPYVRKTVEKWRGIIKRQKT